MKLPFDQHTMIIYQLIFYIVYYKLLDMKALYKDKIQNKDVTPSIYLLIDVIISFRHKWNLFILLFLIKE